MKYDALVIGSGPNGLTAAAVLAKAGHKVKVFEAQPTAGGGARTLELTLPGFKHDLCSAIHPLAAASPVFQELKLPLKFVHPRFPFVHPLDAGEAGVLERDVDATAARLGVDERAWQRLMRPLVRDFHEVLLPLALNPVTSPPLGTPLRTAAFGLKILQSAFWFAEENFETPHAKALLAGCAAHSFSSLDLPLTNTFALLLAAAGHAVGWPMLEGGSQTLVTALTDVLRANGGELETGHPVTSLRELPDAKVVLFDTHAKNMATICGDALPGWYHAALEGFRSGPAVFKLDYALSGPMPWLNPEAHGAGTLHLGGTLSEVARSEREVNQGHVPEWPYVLVAQHTRFDATRAPAGGHTLWAYCHVPNGSAIDATANIERQLDRFAPGWRSLVLHRNTRTTRDLEATNANFIGGDISAGSIEGVQAMFRPLPGRPYVTPNPKVLLCSSSTPPGPGVHGMCGFHAAQVAMRRIAQ